MEIFADLGHLKIQGAVYLNQLMSFAAVTAPALLALQQTGTFNEQLQQLQQTMTWISIPVQAGLCQAEFCVFCFLVLK